MQGKVGRTGSFHPLKLRKMRGYLCAMTNSLNLLPHRGEVYYFPSAFPAARQSSLYQALVEEIAWEHEPIRIFGREIMQPRLTAWYGDEGKAYTYSGVT